MYINNTTFNSASLVEVCGKDPNLVKMVDERSERLKINNDFTYEKPSTLVDVWGRNNIIINKLLEIIEKVQNIVLTPVRATTNFISTKTSDLINYLSSFRKSSTEQFFDVNEFIPPK